MTPDDPILTGFPGDRPFEPPGTPGDLGVGDIDPSLMDEDADV